MNRLGKISAAIAAGALSICAVQGLSASGSSASEIVFDFRSDGKNTVQLSADAVAAKAQTVPFSVYIPENPGVRSISLKMQINDGQPSGDLLLNYGFEMTCEYAEPYCFDSQNGGSPYGRGGIRNLTAERMNLVWVYDAEDAENADAAASPGRAAWDSSQNWVYDNAFLTGTLTVPKGTPAGTYQLDVRREPYVPYAFWSNGSQQTAESTCSGLRADGISFKVAYDTIPLVIEIGEGGKVRCPGDTDGNGQVNVADAVLLARVAGNDPQVANEITAQGLENADVDGKNGVTGDDLTLLLRVLAHLEVL